MAFTSIVVPIGGGIVADVKAAAPSPNDRAQALLAQIDADGANRSVAASAVSNARKALDRATEARKRNDAGTAAVLDDVALSWAELGLDLQRATVIEAKASTAEKNLTEIETKIDRAQALLEETMARQGRAQQKLKELESTKPASKPAGGHP